VGRGSTVRGEKVNSARPDRSNRVGGIKKATPQWGLSQSGEFPHGQADLPCHLTVLREVPRPRLVARRPDGAGGSIGAAEFRGSQLLRRVTTSRTDLRLLNVARASCGELLVDFEDYLRPAARHNGQHSRQKLGRCAKCRSGGSKDPANPSDRTDPTDLTHRIRGYPRCGKATVLRTAKAGKNAGRQFWGCSDYPACKGTVGL
jgi:hypothetical protein